MNRLSKFFLGVLLLTVASASWAACPEGYKSNYKWECVPIPGAVIKTAEGVVSIDPNFILKEEDQGLISERIKNSASHNKPYGYQVVTAPFPVRDGQYAERFEVQPGDCGAAYGWSDCDTSRERWEIYETRNKPGKGDFNSKGKMWYTFSIFFPDDYPIVAPVAVTHVQWKENPQGKGEADSNLFHFRFTGDERALRLTVHPKCPLA